MSRKSRAFTLIELLVVVAIIALLISILLPSLAKAREQSKTLICGTHMRQVGQIVTLYAGEHDGRGPGGGNGTEGGKTPSDSLTWNDVLNAEELERPDNTQYGLASRFGTSSSTTTLACPNFIPAGPTDYSRPMCYNDDASGDDGNEYPIANPTDMNSYYPSAAPLNSYYYGAKLERFHSDQFMLIEAYAGDDVTLGVEANNNLGQLTGGISPGPAYTATNTGLVGNYGPAFRHPFFKGANFLFMDGHIEVRGPKGDVGDHPSSFNGWTAIGPRHMAMPQ